MLTIQDSVRCLMQLLLLRPSHHLAQCRQDLTQFYGAPLKDATVPDMWRAWV